MTYPQVPATTQRSYSSQIVTSVSSSGLTGATAASRYAGATTSGAPVTGTFAVGDYVIDQTAAVWICTVAGAGTTATWGQAGGGAVTYPITIAEGGTGTTTAAAAYSALSPMTTTGDIEYESAAGTASRLAGNTTAVKNFLTQTGNGTISAAPAWGTITASDIPAYVPAYIPSDAGYLAWTADPATYVSSIVAAADQVLLERINIRSVTSVTNVVLYVTVAGSSLTASENYAGLYNGQTNALGVAGTLIAASAAGSADTAFASTGVCTMALSGGPYSLPVGFYWAAFLVNYSGTQPAFSGVNNSAAGPANNGFTVATLRAGRVTSTGKTALPASFVPASGLTQTSGAYWAALS